MASIKISLPHKLPKEEALKRIKSLLSKVKIEFSEAVSDLKESWDGNTGKFSFSAKGFSISGTLVVNEALVQLDGKIPFAVSFFKKKIEAVIETEARKVLF